MKNKEVMLPVLLTAVVVGALVIYFGFINPDMLQTALTTSENKSKPVPAAKEFLIESYTATGDETIALKNTEGKSFKLSGEVWLNGASTTPTFNVSNSPDGFTLYIRQTNELHRYELNSSFARDKRRLLAGRLQSDIAGRVDFPSPVLHTWIPFSVSVSANQISYSFGKNSNVFIGPLDTDGNNQMILNAGSQLRKVQIQIEGADKPN